MLHQAFWAEKVRQRIESGDNGRVTWGPQWRCLGKLPWNALPADNEELFRYVMKKHGEGRYWVGISNRQLPAVIKFTIGEAPKRPGGDT